MDFYSQCETILPDITNENKVKRRNAMKRLQSLLFEDLTIGKEEFKRIFNLLDVVLISRMSDESEVNRSIACELLLQFLAKDTFCDKSVMGILSILSHRVGRVPQLENSEEVRLNYLSILDSIIDRFQVLPYMSDIIDILKYELEDPCPEAVLSACNCTCKLSISTKPKFKIQSDSLLRPLLKAIGHQRYKIRVKALEAIGCVLVYGNGPSLKEIREPLMKCASDIPQVRLELVHLGSFLAKELPDRYSFFPIILPLILFGLRDEDNNIKATAEAQFVEVGTKYEKENEEDLKSDLDLWEKPHYFPPDEPIFGVGCQRLAQKSLYHIMPWISNNIHDWMNNARLRAVKLLTALVLSAREDATQYSDQIIPCLYAAAFNSDALISKEGLVCAKYLGYFSEPDVFLPLMEPYLRKINSRSLDLLFHLLSGSLPPHLEGHIFAIMNVLGFPYEACVVETDCLSLLLDILNLLIEECSVKEVIYSVLYPLVYMMGLNKDHLFSLKPHEVMDKLAEQYNLNSKDLVASHMETFFSDLKDSSASWEEDSPELIIFLHLSQHEGVKSNFSSVSAILNQTMKRSDSPLLTFALLECMRKVVENSISQLPNDELHSCILLFLSDHVKKLLHWNAGRTSEALRTAAVAFVLSFARCFPKDESTFEGLKPSLKLIGALVTDESPETRNAAILIIQILCTDFLLFLEIKTFLDYTELLVNRMEDKNRDIRLTAAESLCKMYMKPPAMLTGCKQTIEQFCQSMIIYLDEEDLEFRQSVFTAIKHLGALCPDYLKTHLKEELQNYRNKQLCEELLRHFEQLSTKDV